MPAISAHAKAQAIRFARLFVVAFAATGVLTAGAYSKSAVVGAVVGALEVAFRQFSQVTPAPPAA